MQGAFFLSCCCDAFHAATGISVLCPIGSLFAAVLCFLLLLGKRGCRAVLRNPPHRDMLVEIYVGGDARKMTAKGGEGRGREELGGSEGGKRVQKEER